MNKVQIIADSICPRGHRLTTVIATFPRYLLAEANTHRALSRNSASSRAIRFEKILRSVVENPFIPFQWQKDHAGMQGSELLDPLELYSLEDASPKVQEILYKVYSKDEDDFVEDEVSHKAFSMFSQILERFSDKKRTLEEWWLVARDNVIQAAVLLNSFGVTKQICNRLLEPFMYHTALVSATELENFLALRAHDAAEIHLQDLAYRYLVAMNSSTPLKLKEGDWHIPFGDNINESELLALLQRQYDESHSEWKHAFHSELRDAKVKIATVRAARISYALPGTEQKHDYEADLKLHDRLASSGHWSAFEHCARVMTEDEYQSYLSGRVSAVQTTVNWKNYYPDPENLGWCGNFRGFIQYRKMFSDENRSDPRLIKQS